MNDAWDPIEDLEPLDHDSLGLLAAYRDAAGPSEDAEARMLAGLRSRLSTEPSADAPAPAVSGETGAAPREPSTSSNARTFAIAAVAFAAGVALTVSLGRPGEPQDSRAAASRDADQHAGQNAGEVATRDSAGLPGPHRPDSYAPGSDFPSTSGTVEPMAERSWPLSVADLTKPQELQPGLEPALHGPNEIDPEDGPAPLGAGPTRQGEGNDDPSRPRGRSADDGFGGTTDGATASRSPLRGGADPSASGRGTAIQGAWAPSVSGAPAGAGIGSAARNPAVAGPSPTAPSSGSSNAGGESPSDKAPSDPPPADEPPPPDEPEPEEENDPEDDQSLDERCAEEFDACSADADTFCESGYPGCESVHEFCFMRSMMCLDEDNGFPHPEYPPEEPEPDDCDMDYSICMMEADAVCMLEKMVPEECEQMIWHCDEMMAMCYGEPPPEPWW